MTEREIAARLQYDMLRLGADKMSFDPIVVTGPNGSLPHGVNPAAGKEECENEVYYAEMQSGEGKDVRRAGHGVGFFQFTGKS